MYNGYIIYTSYQSFWSSHLSTPGQPVSCVSSAVRTSMGAAARKAARASWMGCGKHFKFWLIGTLVIKHGLRFAGNSSV